MTTDEGVVAPRETGWRVPLLALILIVALPSFPPLQLLVPLDRLFLLIAPALAACAIVGWKGGGRPLLAIGWTLLAGWVVWGTISTGGTFAFLAGGWAVLLAASFGGVLLSGWGERFLPRALLAIGIALGLGVLAVVAAGGGFASTLAVFVAETARRTALAQAAWIEFTGSTQWAEFVAGTPNAGLLTAEVERQFSVLPQMARVLLPAMLALESLAVLALSWSLYHRFGRSRLGPPLAALREMTFHDGVVWGLIAGLVVVVVPVPAVVWALGMNLLVFASVLYAVRGLGVMLWFISPGRWMLVLLTVVFVLFLQIVGVVAVGIGLGDTWLDWRRRLRPKSQRSE